MDKQWRAICFSEIKEWKYLIFLTIIVPLVNNQMFLSGYIYVMALAVYLMILKYLKPIIRFKSFWITNIYLGISGAMLCSPAWAAIEVNESACAQQGLFAPITNFVDSMFSTITFEGFGGGALSSLLCQIVGFFILGTLLSFLAGAAVACYRFNEGETISRALQPMMGFLLFGGMATIMVTAFFGSSTAT